MIRFTLILIGTVAVLNVVDAANENMTLEQIYDLAQNVLNQTEKWQQDLKNQSIEGRKSKFFPFGLLPFHALWGFGGLHALAILFVIKFKFIIIASVIAFSIYYYTKFVAAKKLCHNDRYREGAVYPADTTYTGSSFYSSPITSYSSPFASDISSHSFEPYSGYHHDSTIHSDIPPYAYDHDHDHDHHDFDHHHHDFEHHSSDFDHYYSDHGSPHDISSVGGDAPPGVDTKDSSNDQPPAMSPTYRRVGKHRRKRDGKQQQFDFIDIGELAFRFLGVDTEGCRKRFVCELDFRAQTNPITRLAFSFIGRNFFERYRGVDENVTKPQKFADCAKVFNDCKDAEKYGVVNDDDEEKEEEQDQEDEIKNNEDKPEQEREQDEVDTKDDETANSDDLNEKDIRDSNQIDETTTNRSQKIVRNYIFNRKMSIV